jgi:hypothetical protein
MKKLPLILVFAAGFLLGSRAGTEPYEEVESKIRNVVGKPKVQEVVDKVKDVAQGQADSAMHRIEDKLPAEGI